MTFIRKAFKDLDNESLIDAAVAAKLNLREALSQSFAFSNVSQRSLQDYFLYLKQLKLILQTLLPYLKEPYLHGAEELTSPLSEYIFSLVKRIKADLAFIQKSSLSISKHHFFLSAIAVNQFHQTYKKYLVDLLLTQPFNKLSLIGTLLSIVEERLINHFYYLGDVTELYKRNKIFDVNHQSAGLALLRLPKDSSLPQLESDLVGWLNKFVAFAKDPKEIRFYNCKLISTLYHPPGTQPEKIKKQKVKLSDTEIAIKTQVAKCMLQNYQLQLQLIKQINQVEPVSARESQITVTAQPGFFQQYMANPVIWAASTVASTA